MNRAARLFDLLQALRRRRSAVSGRELAAELGVSLRTLYRDMATLQTLGAGIEGAAGVGYTLRPGFLLPPLMFSPNEVEALVLGARWVRERADPRLARAAGDAVARIAAVLPPDLRHELDSTTLFIGPGADIEPDATDLADLRAAIRSGRKARIVYRDESGNRSERVVWPFGIGYFERVRLVLAWCELRRDYRHFRTDRLDAVAVLEERMPRGRAALLAEWRQREGVRRELQ